MSDKIQSMISYFEETARHPKESVMRAMKETDRRAVGCFPYYTPEEIIYAGKMLPVGLWGGQTETKLADRYLQSFCCSIMRANVEFGMRGEYDLLSAVIIPAYCDTLKCIIENWKVAVPKIRLIPMVYPNNRKIRAGIDFMISEFERVKEEMENITGKKITQEDLNNSISVYEDYRSTMQKFVVFINDYPSIFTAKVRHLIIKASYFSDKMIYTAKLKELMGEVSKKPKENSNGIKVVITGILADSEELLDVFEENNISVVADDLAHESRQFRTSASRGDSPLERLALRMSNQDCAMLYDDKKTRGQNLIKSVKDTSADAAVISMLKFCDPEEFDYPILKKELEEAKIPMLYLEIEQTMNSVEQIRTRIQSFAEMLK